MMSDCTVVISDCMMTEALMMAERCSGSTRNRSMMPRSISSSTVIPLHMLVDSALMITTPGTR
jgi:hypothetical protein